MDRRKTLGIVTASAMIVVGLALSAIIFKSGTPFSTPTQAGSYTLTLNNSNGVSGSSYSGTKTITTDSGDYHVDFDYTSCSSMSGGHAVIANGGKIVNKDHIRSIYQVVANFSGGTLKFRSSYDGSNWSGYTTMTSLQPYSLGSNPYYIELSASESNVNLTSVTFSYTCVENPDAQEGLNTTGDDYYEKVTENQSDWSGTYMLVFEYSDTVGYAFNSSYSNNAHQTVTLDNGIIHDEPVCSVTLATMSGGYSVYMNGGNYGNKYIYGSQGSNRLESGTTADDCSVVFEDGTAHLYWNAADDVIYPLCMHAGVAGVNTTTAYDADWCIKFYKPTSGVVVDSLVDNPRMVLYKFVESVDPNVPDDETGFTATDSNKDSYTTNSTFDNDNNLVVKATFSNSSPKTLTSSQYSYVVKDSNNNAINTAAKFPAAGTYTLIVSYGSYIPVEIQLNVGVYTYLTSISARMTTSAFTTADTLSNSISGALEVDMHYNVSSADKTVYYSNLSENGLSASLLDPNGVTKPMTSPFGVAGAWKVRIVSTSNSTIYDEVSLTVSAIQVIDITMAPTSLSLYVNESANLSVTFNPTTATNQNVTWTSGDASRVSVSGNGASATVTAHAVTLKDTPVTITATSEDGNKQATCSVTVKNKVTTTATIVSAASGTNDATYTASTSDFTTDGITLTDAESSGSTYYSSDTGIRLGKGSGTGSLTFSFSSTVVTGITIRAKYYNNDSNATVKISTSANTSGESVAINSSTAADFVTTSFNSDSQESTYVKVETETNGKRIYFYSLTLTLGVANPVYPESISLTNQNLAVGESITLEPTFSPSDTNQTNVTWSSNNTNIATVDANGLVTAVAQGSATITCTGHDENGDDVIGTCTITVHTVAVTGVSVKSTDSVAVGQSITLTATVSPSNATDKVVTWSSSNTSKATVNANTGLVTGVAAGTAVITATTHDGGFTAQCTVTVSTVQLDEWTLLFYVCGSNLESDSVSQGGGSAKSDLQEILSVRSQQPSTVNIAVETGGCTYWRMPNVKNDELGRWEIGNISGCSSTAMKKIDAVEDASMGESSTLQDFLEWGIQAYPARKYGLFMWNHGGAMDGCCFDDNHDGDGLYSNEVDAAVTAAKQTRGISDNLEFIAYDACLMAVQDIAEFNSHNFNYMISSQETEWSGGYDYDAWLPTLYANPSTVSTTTVLSKVGDTFMDYYENAGKNDQTQAVYDLSKMAAYKAAFETMTDSLSAIVTNSTKWDAFAAKINTAKKYAYDEDASDYNGGYAYDIFDAKGALTALKNDSTYNSAKSKIEAVLSLLTIGEGNLIVYERHGSEMGGSNGMCLFCPISGYNQVNGAYFNTSSGQKWFDANYSAERTNFTKWQAFVAQYGNWAA